MTEHSKYRNLRTFRSFTIHPALEFTRKYPLTVVDDAISAIAQETADAEIRRLARAVAAPIKNLGRAGALELLCRLGMVLSTIDMDKTGDEADRG